MMCRGKQNTVLLVKEVIRHLGISGKDGRVCPFNIGPFVFSCGLELSSLGNRKRTLSILHPPLTAYY